MRALLMSILAVPEEFTASAALSAVSYIFMWSSFPDNPAFPLLLHEKKLRGLSVQGISAKAEF